MRTRMGTGTETGQIMDGFICNPYIPYNSQVHFPFVPFLLLGERGVIH